MWLGKSWHRGVQCEAEGRLREVRFSLHAAPPISSYAIPARQLLAFCGIRDEIRAASLKSLIFGPTQASGKITDFTLISYRGDLGFTCLTSSLWAEVEAKRARLS